MKKNLFKNLIAAMLFFLPAISNGQTITLGTSSQFVLFTSVGAITNSGTNFETRLTGKVGSNSGSSTGFANVDGTMNSGDPVTAAATTSLTTAYTQLNTATPTGYPSALLGNDTFVAGVYSIPSAATLTSTITLDAQGNPGAVFIFQINGSFSAATNSKVRIINGGLACNVYWKTEGLASIGSGSTMRGTIVAHNAAISFGTLDTLEGRALSLNGAITLNSLTGYTPIGCGSATLTGPTAPTLGAVGTFALFSSNGPVTNGGAITYVTGDIGTNLGLTTGYNPLYVNGIIHPIPDAATAAAATALTSAYGQLNLLPNDIELLYPALFGHNQVLTPHTYLLNAATSFTDTIFLNAQGNSNAVFVIKTNGALSITSGSYVKLINGTQAKNVYWKVEGAVGFANNTTFQGTVVANNGAIDITSGATFNGRALTTTGALTTNGANINAPVMPTTGTITSDSVVCVGASIPLTGVDTGGTWSVSNSNASVTNTGIVTGVSAGIDTAIYTVGNRFGTLNTTKRITVNPLPNAGTISGPSSVCVGATIMLTDPAPGGVWTSSNATATVVAGLVTGISPGIDTIRYSVTNTCGTAIATKIINIYAIPNVNVTASQIVCNGAPTTAVNFTGAVSGTTFTWTNDKTSIGLAGTGTGNIPSFTAINITNLPVIANVVVIPSANGCTGTNKNFTYTVNPTPNVASVTNQTLCNGFSTTAVNFTGTVIGTAFNWTNDNTSIGLAGTGIGNIPSFTALNTTNAPSIGNIRVTPAANGCTGASNNFEYTVNPTPVTDVVANQAVCNGLLTAAVNFTGAVSGSTFSWTNDKTSIGLASAGTGNISSFIALNTTNTPVIAAISVVPAANGCIGLTSTFTITVNSTPTAPVIGLMTPSSVCDMTYFRNFGAATLPPAGMRYSWSAINASISDTGSTEQYALVNFKKVGTGTVVLTSTVINTGCLNTAQYAVTVSSSVADTTAKVIYFNNSFICLQNNEEAYAWGYDDSKTLAPTWLTGEINQDYVNASPNLESNRYWVMVTHNGCIQKTYYNKPENALMRLTTNKIIVFPNPATEQIKVGVSTTLPGDILLEIYNTLGRKVYTINSSTDNNTIDVSTYPPGVYMIICYRNNEKITANFIKH